MLSLCDFVKKVKDDSTISIMPLLSLHVQLIIEKSS